MSIQRYDSVDAYGGEGLLHKAEGGDVVLFTDHAAEVERLNAIVLGLTDPIKSANCRMLEYHQLKEEVERLTDENERLIAEQVALVARRKRNIDELKSERDAAVARAERAEEALREATLSLETISKKAGRDEYMEDMLQVRGYANSRATVARAALAAAFWAG